MKILVTGGLGRIGEHLVDELRKNNPVLATDLIVSYTDGYMRMDVSSREDIDEVMEAWCPELTIHMAGEVGRLNGEAHPQRMLRTNCLGTLNITKACLKHGSRLINFSTSEVYGSAFDSHYPMDESGDLDAFAQANVYSISKMTGESIVRHYVKNYGLEAITVRPFMVYGEGETPSKYRSALTNFVWAALNGRKFDVHKGTGRAWCHVDDFVQGLSLLLDMRPRTYQAFNIGSEEYHPMEEVASMVIQETMADPSLINLVDAGNKFGVQVKHASIDKMKALGYKPRITLREGIRRVVKWQRENLLG